MKELGFPSSLDNYYAQMLICERKINGNKRNIFKWTKKLYIVVSDDDCDILCAVVDKYY